MRSAAALALVGVLGLCAHQAEAWDKPETPKSGPSSGGHASPRGGEGGAMDGPKPSASTSSSGSDSSKPRPSAADVREQKQDKAERRPTGAQLRHPRAGTGHGSYRDEGYRHYEPYNPYRYGYSYWAPYYYGYGYYGPTYYGYHGYPASQGQERDAGAVRLQVPQEDAAVYVDGHYAGKVDDYNGVFERLYLEPGPHEIMLRLDGYRTHRFRIYVPLDKTLKIRHEMVRGEGEDVVDLSDWYEGEPEGEVSGGPAGYARLEEPAAATPPAVAGLGVDVENWGRLRFDVQPDDASIYVDGEFRGTAIDLRSIKLPAGMHKVEVVRPGFGTVERDVEVRPNQTADFTVELGRS